MTRSNSKLAVVDDKAPSLNTPADRLATVRQDAITFTDEQLGVLQETYFKNCTETEINLALAVCKATGLDPFLKQIVFIKRWDSNAPKPGGGNGKYVLTAQPTIDGTRLMAQRSGRYGGQVGPLWCGKDGVWKELWLDTDNPPVAAKVEVYGIGQAQPIASAVCMFNTYAVKDKNGNLTQFWKKMPELMIGKCAESLALRKAFPAEYSQFGPPPTARQMSEDVEFEQRVVEHDGLNWDADTGEIVQHDEAVPEPEPGASLRKLHAVARDKQIGTRELHNLVYGSYKVESIRELKDHQMDALASKIERGDRNDLLKQSRAVESMRSRQNAPDDAGTPEDADTIDCTFTEVDATETNTGDAGEGDSQDIGESIIAEFIAAYESCDSMDAFKALGEKVITAGIWDPRVAEAQVRKLQALLSSGGK